MKGLRPATLGSAALDRTFAALAVLSLATIWAFRYPSGVDLPQHANIMRILADYTDPATGYAAFYERQFLTPYFVTYLVGLPFTKLFGALVGVKVVRAFDANVVIDAIRDGEGALIGFAKITLDITERKRAE